MKLLLKIVASGFVLSLLSGTDAVSDTTGHYPMKEAHQASFVVKPQAHMPNEEAVQRFEQMVSRDHVLALLDKNKTLAFEGRHPVVKEVAKKDCKQALEQDARIVANEPCKEPKVITIYRALEHLFSLPK